MLHKQVHYILYAEKLVIYFFFFENCFVIWEIHKILYN